MARMAYSVHRVQASGVRSQAAFAPDRKFRIVSAAGAICLLLLALAVIWFAPAAQGADIDQDMLWSNRALPHAGQRESVPTAIETLPVRPPSFFWWQTLQELGSDQLQAEIDADFSDIPNETLRVAERRYRMARDHKRRFAYRVQDLSQARSVLSMLELFALTGHEEMLRDIIRLRADFEPELQQLSRLAAYYLTAVNSYDLTEDQTLTLVDVESQRLFVVRHGQILTVFPVSTSRYGIGTTSNSNKTPFGMHRVYLKSGSAVPVGGIFDAMTYRERIASELHLSRASSSRDALITTRLIWLEGAEPRVNAGGNTDTRRRGIFIHGTNYEADLGLPASKGCIRMSNLDIIDLYSLLSPSSLVGLIEPASFPRGLYMLPQYARL